MEDKQTKESKIYDISINSNERTSVFWHILLFFLIIFPLFIVFEYFIHKNYYYNLQTFYNKENYFKYVLSDKLFNDTQLKLNIKWQHIIEDNLVPNKNIQLLRILYEEFKYKSMFLNNESVYTKFSENFSNCYGNSLLSNENFNQKNVFFNDVELNFFENNTFLNYQLDDFMKLFYIYFPVIHTNFKFHNRILINGFLTIYPVLSDDLPKLRQNLFENYTNRNVFYFNFPIRQVIGNNIGNAFCPKDFNKDPVPWLLRDKNYSIYKNWLTSIDRDNLLSTKNISEYRNILTKESDLKNRNVKKTMSLFTHKMNLENITIFLNLGFKVSRNEYGKDLKKSDYFTILNLYGNSSNDDFKIDFLNDTNTFDLEDKIYPNETKVNLGNSEYFSYDNSRSTLNHFPLNYNTIYQNFFVPLTNNIVNFNGLSENIKQLSQFSNYFDISYYYKNDSFIFDFIYTLNKINHFIISNDSYNQLNKTCSEIDFTDYYNKVKSIDIDCLDDENIELLKSYNSENPKKANIYGNVLNCYCMWFICLNISKFKTDYPKIIQNGYNIEDYYSNENKIILPEICEIKSKLMFDIKSKPNVNWYTLVIKKTKFNSLYSDLTTIFLIDDSNYYQNYYNFCSETSEILKNILNVYLGIIAIFSIFMIYWIVKSSTLIINRIDFVSNIYYRLLKNNKDLNDEYKIKLSKKFKKEQFKDTILKKSKYLTKDDQKYLPESFSSNDWMKAYEEDEIDDFYKTFCENIEKFQIDFNGQSKLSHSNIFQQNYKTYINVKMKLGKLFIDNEYLTKNYGKDFISSLNKEKVDLTNYFIQEICYIHYFDYNFYRNFNFRDSLNERNSERFEGNNELIKVN